MGEQNNIFAENLIFYRKKNSMLQKDLAAKLGVSTSAVSNWESGINYPRLDTVYKICDALEISVGQLLGLGDSLYSRDDQELLDAYKEHPEMQDAVQKLLGL